MFKGLPEGLPQLPGAGSGLTDKDEVKQRALAAYLGLAVGDALGAPAEFMVPNEIAAQYGILKDMTGGGWLKIKPGRVTDDTEMCLALGDAILETGGVEAVPVAEHFVEWMRSKPIDIGSTVRRGIQNYIATGRAVMEWSEFAAGNGAAMRNLPVIIATLNHPDLLGEWSRIQSRVTHNNEVSDTGTMMVSDLTRRAIWEGQSAPLQSAARIWAEAYPTFNFQKYRREHDGYIVTTVKTALHFFFNTFDFESCLVGIVNQGGDSDTNAAIGGMLAGAFYGLDAIPPRWLNKLDKKVRADIEKQTDALLAV